MKNLISFIDTLQSQGRYTFLKEEAIRVLNISSVAFKLAAERLSRKGRLFSPKRRFFVIIPTEYLGSVLPSPWYIDDLMRFLDAFYYVGLLSAATFLGAAHHQPQALQIISNHSFRTILKNKAKIRFFKKTGNISKFVNELKTPTGMMRVSSPELTAFDLTCYASKIGGLDLAGTVLAELSGSLNAKELVNVAKTVSSRATIQRVGYLLDYLGHERLSKSLHVWLKPQKLPMTLLRVDSNIMQGPRNDKWRLILNEKLEIET